MVGAGKPIAAGGSSRKEVVQWDIGVLASEVVAPKDSWRAVRRAATVS